MKSQVIFSGGLGNQMFQYAFYLFLRTNGKEPQINANMYQYMKMHSGYMLNIAFGIESSSSFKNSKIAAIIIYFLVKYHPKLLVYTEKRFGAANIEEILNSDKLFFNGCWINPVYFNEIEGLIRRSFTFVNMDKRNLAVGGLMRATESVSVHIRRGDYLKYAQYAVCNDSYYSDAINFFKNQLNKPVFYIFSDDPKWCESFMENFEITYEIITDNNNEDSYKDMYLMSCCRHNIIANSTFSWWGAWLNNNINKIVVCPSVWIKGEDYNPCPNEWLRFN